MNVVAVLDHLIGAEAVAEMIVVMPDCWTALGGAWYTNSPTAGNWTDFIADDVVHHIDERYRTISASGGRGIAGHSMGAYGALRIAARRPETFGAVVAISPANVVDPHRSGSVEAAGTALAVDPAALHEAAAPARALWSRAAAFSPNTNGEPPHAILPFGISGDSIVVIPEIWKRWEENTLLADVRMRPGALRRLAIGIDVGRADPLLPDIIAYSDALERIGVYHDFRTFPGTGVASVRKDLERSVFDFFSVFFHRPWP